MANGPFVKVYQSIVDDPDMEEVCADDRLLGTWLRLLMVAHAFYPISAPLPKGAAVRRLVGLGLVTELPAGRYTIKGLASERAKRSHAGRIGAAVRWQSDGNAEPMLGRGRGRTEEKRGDGIAIAHHGQHDDCAVCAPLRKETA